MPEAIIAKDAFLLSEVQRLPGNGITLVAPCADYDAFQALPRVIRFEGQTFGLTGWNGDYQQAYWKPSNLIASIEA